MSRRRRRRNASSLLCMSLATIARGGDEEPAIRAKLAPPAHAIEPNAPSGKLWVRHPWAIRDREAELNLEKSESAPPPTRNVVTRDGVEFVITVAPRILAPAEDAAIQVSLFSIAYTGPESGVEAWMQDGGLPPEHNALRTTSLFASQYPGGKVTPDDLGDVCLGDVWRFEACARVTSCFRVRGAVQGGGVWRVAVPMQWASFYRFEVYLRDPAPICKELLSEEQRRPPGWHAAGAPELAWWAPLVASHVSELRPVIARYAAYEAFKLLYVTKVNWWWGHNARLEPADSWMEMMNEAMSVAARSAAGSPKQVGFRFVEGSERGLWLEFGVGSGRTTAVIAWRLKAIFGGEWPEVPVLHGFDSFQGLPVSWDHTKLGVGTFTMNGEVPEHLAKIPNVKVHVGLFSSTLTDLDEYQGTPVAFAHIDVDLYASAVEVLSRIACQLYAGSVLVFDELANYDGFELSGEYRAWEYVAAAYGINWQYMGFFWQQAVPVLILERGVAC